MSDDWEQFKRADDAPAATADPWAQFQAAESTAALPGESRLDDPYAVKPEYRPELRKSAIAQDISDVSQIPKVGPATAAWEAARGIAAGGVKTLSAVDAGINPISQLMDIAHRRGVLTSVPSNKELFEKLTPSSPDDPGERGYYKAGELASVLAPVGSLRVGGAKAAEALRGAIRAGDAIAPFATSRAQKLVEKIATPSDPGVIGEKIQAQLVGTPKQPGRLLRLKTDRAAEAKKLIAKYKQAGAGKEPDIIRKYAKYIEKQATGERRRALTTTSRKVLADSLKAMQNNPNIEGLENELRRLKDIGRGKSGITEGVDAIRDLKARQASKILEGILNKTVPEGKAYRQAYEAASEPIDLYETVLGKAVGKEDRDPAKLANEIFKSKFSLNRFRDLTGGDEAFVRDMAKEHIATELKGLDAEKARQWLDKNQSWLNQMPAVRLEADRYVANLERIKRTQTIAKWGAGAGALALGIKKGLF